MNNFNILFNKINKFHSILERLSLSSNQNPNPLSPGKSTAGLRIKTRKNQYGAIAPY